jgi:hypothetical protein
MTHELEEESLMQRLITLVWVVVAATSLVVGCGSNSDSGSAGASSDPQCVGDYADLKVSTFSAGVATSGACVNAADLGSVCSNDVTGKAEGCGLDCLTMAAADMDACVASCLNTQVKPALSSGCVTCYATDVGCARDNCKFMCLSPTSAACTTCREQFGCIDAFYSCSGLPVPGSSSNGAGGAGDTAATTAGAGG